MKQYMVLSTLTPEGSRTVKDNPDRIKQVNKTVEAFGTKIVAQYALLGPYDFLTILEAEDNIDVFQAAIEVGSRGTLKTLTIPAIPINEFIETIKG